MRDKASVNKLAKCIARTVAAVLVLPLGVANWLEQQLSADSEVVFLFLGQGLALIPGLPGVYFRRAFYRMSLISCSPHCFIGFGTFFTHRQVVVEAHVYVGNYTTIGSATLREGCLVGSRVSLLSGGNLHVLSESEGWGAADLNKMVRIELGRGAWIGEGAIVMADVGNGSMISAGAVVATAVGPCVMMAGNPARFVQKLNTPTNAESSAASEPAITESKL